MKKIVLADDHAIVRTGVRTVLERLGKDMQVVAELSNGKELVDYAKDHPDDIYVVDISMPVMNGIEAVEQLVKFHPEAKVIMLSMYDDRLSVEKSLKAGAKGFIVKVSAADEIVSAIKKFVPDGSTCVTRFPNILCKDFWVKLLRTSATVPV